MDNIETNLITLSRHVLHDQTRHSNARGDLTLLLTSIQLGCKFVASQVRRSGLANLTGLAGKTNVQGEDVKKLDVLANDTFINSLKSSGRVSVLVSEENENEIIVDSKGLGTGKYAVVFDPLDGSSNIDAGVSIGTIFGIYHVSDPANASKRDVLKAGKEMVAAGYAMYGSSTTLVLTTGNGVNGYTLDPIKIPERHKIYSVNEGNSLFWDEPTKEYFNSLKFPADGKPYSARYIGSMVADVRRTLLYGGVFAYPADNKSKNGKLRLLYECFPMAMILEQAGGKASTGRDRILDIVPDDIHARSPIVLGSKLDFQCGVAPDMSDKVKNTDISHSPIKVIFAVSFYVFASITTVLLNKQALNSLPIPITFLFAQLVIAVIILHILSIFNFIELPEININILKKLSMMILVNIFGLVMNTYCLNYLDASLYQVARSLVLPITVSLSWMYLKTRPSIAILSSCGIVFLGFLVGVFAEKEINISTKGIVFGCLSSFTTALHAVVIKKSFAITENGMFDMVYYNNVFSAFGLIPFVLFERPDAGAYFTLFGRSAFLRSAIITGISGFLINVAGFLQIQITSPVTHMISSAVRGVLQTILAAHLLGEIVTSYRVAGIIFILLGSSYYTWLKNRERSQQLLLPK
ncbi:Fructose-1,6-bisphosphatase domain-containing protein [Rozella allomycis CSF55]|uniref:Fructose-1,6-bisphosphatase n=1 Tax=Rozella allomycis (strain CSF55) TaxID=988480 RepID=A0A075AT76_ROZAC|nr:Fructose-1,6-bisphosphatase domain-containing protein [Rozella allomycis CSF55]|eukprot:EPZ33375.1 Fructose-1,6-bisphosphatase domain-containing protein [Rozella allomycis CSF55]